MNNISTSQLTTRIVALVTIVVVFAVVLVPIINSATQERVDVSKINTGNVGTNLTLYDLTQEHDDKTVTVTVSGDTYVLTGSTSYTGSLSVDQVVMVSDVNSLYVKNGGLYYFDGTDRTQVTDSMTLTISGTQVCSIEGTYVYWPDTEGNYGSYSQYEYSLSDCIAVGDFAGVSLISNGETVQESSMDGFYAHVSKDTEGAVTGVTYDTTAPETNEEGDEE